MLRGVLGGQANNADAVEHRENVGRDHLVGEHDDEGDPEEFHSLLVALGIKMEGCGHGVIEGVLVLKVCKRHRPWKIDTVGKFCVMAQLYFEW